jgi:phospholipid/cholesterol/gamma-HCH transport system substrate-binding protein
LDDLDKAGKSFSSLGETAVRILAGWEPGLRRLSQEGLSDMRMLMLEARTLVQTLNRIARQMESNPRRFFFGDAVKEYPAP